MRKNIKTVIEYAKIESKSKVKFEQIEDKCCFYSGGVLYMKIFQQDLEFLKISNINAISILNAGLTFFEPDEMVYESTKEEIRK